MRHLLSRKTWFYRALLPTLRRLGPVRADALLTGLGRLTPWFEGRHRERLKQVQFVLRADWDLEATLSALAANRPRFAARDALLAGLTDAEALSRFDVAGLENLDMARAGGRGVILLGSHFGAYVAALHGLVRMGLPLRLMVQRPRHVSPELDAMFDAEPDGLHPQRLFFLKRGMEPGEGARRVWRARAVLREGAAVYINGDVAWPSGCARPGRLLGQDRGFLAAWADLAALTGVAVVPIFARHLVGGRFAIGFDPPWSVREGEQQSAVARYLRRLEAEIARHPAEAVAHLTWPSFATRPHGVPAPSTIAQILAVPVTGATAV